MPKKRGRPKARVWSYGATYAVTPQVKEGLDLMSKRLGLKRTEVMRTILAKVVSKPDALKQFIDSYPHGLELHEQITVYASAELHERVKRLANRRETAASRLVCFAFLMTIEHLTSQGKL